MNNMFDVLEICLQEIENGAEIETVLARYPNFAGELRPILETSIKARSMSHAEPSPDAIRRGRARVMQRAAEMREAQATPRKRVIPAFQRLALSFSLAAVLLLSSTGLLNASASALPGENLYPVKRTWEGLRLLLIFDQQARTLLEDQFEYERLQEVNELLTEGRHETIQFAGVFMEVNGVLYVSGVPVTLPSGAQLPANGSAVIIIGQTNSQGVVEIVSLEQLPDGSVVPVGDPIEMELETESESNSNTSGITGNENNSVTTEPAATPQYYSMEGTLQSASSTILIIDSLTVYPENARIKGELCLGARVEVKGYFDKDGRLIVTEVEAKGSCSNTGNGNSNTNSGSSGSNSNDDSNDTNTNSSDNGDDHSSDNGNDSGSDDHGGGGGGDGGGNDNSGGDD